MRKPQKSSNSLLKKWTLRLTILLLMALWMSLNVRMTSSGTSPTTTVTSSPLLVAPSSSSSSSSSSTTTTTHFPTVLVVGYPKSGTTSVYNFFKCNKIRTQHFCCCGNTQDHAPCPTMATCMLNQLSKQQPMLRNCGGDYQVYAQMDGERPTKTLAGNIRSVLLENGTWAPVGKVVGKQGRLQLFGNRVDVHMHFLPQHFYLEKLHEEVPNAVFVLPLRAPEAWATSVLNWYTMRARLVSEYQFYNDTLERPGKVGAREWLERIYTEHSQFVRDFVKTHPSHRLIEFNIQDPNAGEILGNAFGLLASCWGHHNKVGRRGNNITL